MNRRYYWLKLKDDFFQDDTIRWLESQKNGKEYCLFYLKLCLKSLKTRGILIQEVGSILIPYDVETLAKITNTNQDTVKVAMNIFEKINLVEVLEDGKIYLSQIENMVGSETASTIRSRRSRERQRALQCNKNATETTDNRHKTLEIECSSSLIDFVSKQFGRQLQVAEIEEIEKWEDTPLTRLAVMISVLSGKFFINYTNGILNNWRKENITTVEDYQKKLKNKRHRNENLPEWFDKDIKIEVITEDEKKELDNILTEIGA